MTRRLLLSLIAVALATAAGSYTANAGGRELVIGVRVDAAPFAYCVPLGIAEATGDAAGAAGAVPPDDGTRDEASDGCGPAPSNGEQAAVEGRVLRAANFGGYVVRVCDEVIAQFNRLHPGEVTFRPKPVNAQDRFDKLEHEIDILCDPATVTQPRLEKFVGSMPIYLSGITFASQPRESFSDRLMSACAHIVGIVDQTTAESEGIMRILGSGDLGIRTAPVRGYLQDPPPDGAQFSSYDECERATERRGELADAEARVEAAQQALDDAERDSAPDAIKRARDELGLAKDAELAARTRLEEIVGRPGEAGGTAPRGTAAVRAYRSHSALAEDFCARKVIYYVGDIEIVNQKLKAMRNCPYVDAAITYTDERYAIFAATRDNEKASDILRFMQILSERVHSRNSVLIDAFRETFPGFTPTRQLQMLIWSLSGSVPRRQ